MTQQLMTNGSLKLLYVMKKLIHCYQSESVSQRVVKGYVKNCVSRVHLFQKHKKQCRHEN